MPVPVPLVPPSSRVADDISSSRLKEKAIPAVPGGTVSVKLRAAAASDVIWKSGSSVPTDGKRLSIVVTLLGCTGTAAIRTSPPSAG